VRGLIFRPEFRRVLLGLAYQRITGSIPVFPSGPLSVQDLPQEALPGRSWVRVRNRLAGVCGTDLNLLRLRFSMRSATMARRRSLQKKVCLGHEVIGEVVEIGPDVQSFARGQRVVFVPGTSCAGMERQPVCALCERGFPLLCLHRDEFAPSPACGGGWSEEMARHESQWLPIPDEIPDAHAVLIEPLACSVHAVLRRALVAGDTVIVIGCGMIGLGMIMALRALSITPLRIIALSKYEYQTGLAQAAGADVVLRYGSDNLYEQLAKELETEVHSRGTVNQLLHHGAAVVYDAVGSADTVHHALRWTRARGAVVMEGISPRIASFDRSVIWLREVDLLGAHGHGVEEYDGRKIHTFALIMEWMKQGKLRPDRLVTKRYPLAEYRAALGAADRKSESQAVKILFEMERHD